MSEGYTVGGDDFIKIEESTYCCQTFTPTYTHTIAYIDLNCKLCAYYRQPTIIVYAADEDHKPTGEPLSWGWTTWLSQYPTDELARVRFNMRWKILNEGVEYTLVIYFARPSTGQYLYWQYDTADAGYTGGIRLLSLDRGNTWTPYPDSDHIFFEFGKEPAPLPSPDPPVGNFAILDLAQELTTTGIKITVTTNVPCHLYCYWTGQEPEKHLIPILTRGIELHSQLKMCFVNWHENEQEEEGDTLYHTFTKEPWAICETRWLTFRAKVNDNWIPSVGPIFKKHLTQKTVTINPTDVINTCVLERAGLTEESYFQVHSALTSSDYVSGVDVYQRLFIWAGFKYWVGRSRLTFDTSFIGEENVVISAKLELLCRDINVDDDFNITLVSGEELTPIRLNTDYFKLRSQTVSLGSKNTFGIEANDWFTININSLGITKFNKTGTTVFGLRSSNDIWFIEPTGNNEVILIEVNGTPGKRPKLTIEYGVP